MDLSKSEVIDWLKREGRSKDWLARKFNVEPRTVGNWLDRSDRDIPERHIPKIIELMKADSEPRHSLTIKVTTEEFEELESRARAAGLTILEYATKKVTG